MKISKCCGSEVYLEEVDRDLSTNQKITPHTVYWCQKCHNPCDTIDQPEQKEEKETPKEPEEWKDRLRNYYSFNDGFTCEYIEQFISSLLENRDREIAKEITEGIGYGRFGFSDEKRGICIKVNDVLALLKPTK